MKEQQTSHHGEHETCSCGPETQTQHCNYPGAFWPRNRIFASQHDIEVAFECPCPGIGATEKSYAGELARVIAENRPRAAANAETDAPVPGHVLPLDPPGVQIGQNRALGIEQIDLNTGLMTIKR